MEAAALEEVLRRARPRLRRVLFRYRIPAEDAEDLLQETFLLLVAKWDSIRVPEAWLFITLRNRCVIYWRRKRAQVYDGVDTAILELLAEDEATGDRTAGLRVDLERVLDRLPKRCRSLLKLRYGLGCSALETGERLGYRPSSVPKLTRRCLSQLTRHLLRAGYLSRDQGD